MLNPTDQETKVSFDFQSVLLEGADHGQQKEANDPPAFFVDLNLDQIVDSIAQGREEYNLKPYYYARLTDAGSIQYRQEIFRDLEDPPLFAKIDSFAQALRQMRAHLAMMNKLDYRFQKEKWFLDAVEIYCNAVENLTEGLAQQDLRSQGLLAFLKYLKDYTASAPFRSLQNEIQKIKTELGQVRYCLQISENRIKVRAYQGEPDYSASVLGTFEKFKQGAVKDYRVKFSEWEHMNHIEGQILNFVAQLNPEVFADLDNFCAVHSHYLDQAIQTFDREVQFYLAYLEYIAPLKQAGLKFCSPQIISRTKDVYDIEGFDLALASKLTREKSAVVCNDFYLRDQERMLVITGPNQGGKTTFARTFGQLHFLASLGCPVPGEKAQLYLYDHLFTHFEREENIQNLRGKLQDDLVRMHDILRQATPDSIIIANEIFTSTTLKDAVFLGEKVMRKIHSLDALCVWVTFTDELVSASDKNVSMVSSIDPYDPTLRTYKILRKPADGLAYALSLAEKYRLTYDCLQERLKR